MSTAKTITIHLASGDPTGIKIAEVSNRIIRGYVLPREKLSEARNITELAKPALYVLLSLDGEDAYIGETESFLNRISTHRTDLQKDYWDIALVFIAKDGSLEKSDVGYLESIGVEIASRANKCRLHNRTVPSRNNLHPFKVATIEEFFGDAALLSAALGYPIFEVLEEEELEQKERWYCQTKKSDAQAVFDAGRFIVLAGTKIDPEIADSWKRNFASSVEERQEILSRSAKKEEDVYILTENVTFKSPNHAGGFVAGRNVNAWVTWKDKDGRTMDEVLR